MLVCEVGLSMAAIDMKALMREEKARIRAEMAAAQSGGGGGGGDNRAAVSSAVEVEAGTNAASAVDSIEFSPFDSQWSSRPKVNLTDYDVASKIKTISVSWQKVSADAAAG